MNDASLVLTRRYRILVFKMDIHLFRLLSIFFAFRETTYFALVLAEIIKGAEYFFYRYDCAPVVSRRQVSPYVRRSSRHFVLFRCGSRGSCVLQACQVECGSYRTRSVVRFLQYHPWSRCYTLGGQYEHSHSCMV